MKKLKKFFRITGFVIIVIFASLGVGLVGGIPISQANDKKEDTPIVKVEVADENEEASEESEIDFEKS